MMLPIQSPTEQYGIRQNRHCSRSPSNVCHNVTVRESSTMITTNGHHKNVLAKPLSDCDYCAAHLASMTETMVSSVTSNAIVMNDRNVTPDHLYTNLLFPKLSLLLPSKNMTDVNRIAESKICIERMASLYSKNREDSHGHGVYKRMVVVPDVTQQTEIVFQYLLPIRIGNINWHHLKNARP